MDKKPSGVAAAQAFAAEIGLAMQGVPCSDQEAIRVLQDEVQRLRANLRWIPVEERLPPLMTEVLGWHPCDRVRAWFRHSGTVQGGPQEGTYWESWEPQDRECDDCDVNEPTHWMSMPSPPEVK